MIMCLYRLLQLLAFPLFLIFLGVRSFRELGFAKSIPERFGYTKLQHLEGAIWFHAVSAGEVRAIAPLMRLMYSQFPDRPFVVTTMTSTGADQAKKLVGDFASHFFAPYDFRRGVKRVFGSMKPRMLVVVETEIWPNLIDVATEKGVPVVLINARMSARSALGYKRIGPLSRRVFSKLSFVGAQYQADMTRFIELGVPENKISVLGSIKFDLVLPENHKEEVSLIRESWGIENRPVWISASTHSGEEEILLVAHRRVLKDFKKALMILVPRHPNRAESILVLAAKLGLSASRLTQISDGIGSDVSIVVGDTMGDLLYLYGASSIAFVGGSLVAAGGHNPVEPALCGLPILMGPSQFNFHEVTQFFLSKGGLKIVTDADQIGGELATLFADTGKIDRIGQLSRQVVSENTGATEKTLYILTSLFHHKDDSHLD